MQHLLRCIKSPIPENVRMATDQLVIHFLRHRFEIEMLRLFCQLRVKYHLKQHVAKLLPHMIHIQRIDRLQEFATLVHQTFGDRLMILLEVPRATVRSSQSSHGR